MLEGSSRHEQHGWSAIGLSGFRPFSDGRVPKFLCKSLVNGDVVYQRLVELEGLDGQLGEVAEIAIAVAEIVDSY